MTILYLRHLLDHYQIHCKKQLISWENVIRFSFTNLELEDEELELSRFFRFFFFFFFLSFLLFLFFLPLLSSSSSLSMKSYFFCLASLSILS